MRIVRPTPTGAALAAWNALPADERVYYEFIDQSGMQPIGPVNGSQPSLILAANTIAFNAKGTAGKPRKKQFKLWYQKSKISKTYFQGNKVQILREKYEWFIAGFLYYYDKETRNGRVNTSAYFVWDENTRSVSIYIYPGPY